MAIDAELSLSGGWVGKLFVHAYTKSDRSGRRLRGHFFHGGGAESDRRRCGLGGVSFVYEIVFVSVVRW